MVIGGHGICPGWTQLLLALEEHRKTLETKACRESSTLDGHASIVFEAQLNVVIMNVPGYQIKKLKQYIINNVSILL